LWKEEDDSRKEIKLKEIRSRGGKAGGQNPKGGV